MAWNPTDGCETHDITLDNSVVIHNPMLVLCAGMGIVVGIVGFFLTREYLSSQTDHNSPYISSSYTLIYMSFACMNFSGLIVWCFSDLTDTNKDPSGNKTLSPDAKLWLMIDGIFSSITSFNFIIAWMTDVGWFTLNKNCNKRALFVFYALIGIGYFAETYLGWKWGWNLLYYDLTEVGSVSYMLVQFFMMYRSKNYNGIVYIILAALIGLFGLTSFKNSKIQKFYCDASSGWFDGSCVWYTQSDLSLAFLLAYMIKRYGKAPDTNKISNEANEINEKDVTNDLKIPLV